MRSAREPILLFRPLGFLYPYLKVSADIWMAGLFFLPFLTGSFTGATPLEWRAFAGSVTSHHILILWAYVALYAGLRLKGVNPLVGVAAVLMVISTHELFWWGFDYVWMGSQSLPLHWYWLFGYLLPPTLFWFTAYWNFLPFPKRLVLAVFYFDFVWLLAGWPVTVNYIGGVYPTGPLQGLTVWYDTWVGDGWEFLSWAVPCLVMYLSRGELTKGQDLLIDSLSHHSRT